MGLNAKEQMRSYEDSLSTVVITGASFEWAHVKIQEDKEEKSVVLYKRIDLDPEQMVLWWDVS